MKIPGFVWRKAADVGAKAVGKEPAVRKFCSDHKKSITSVFLYLSAWAFWQDCGTITVSGITIDALKFVQERIYPDLICLHVMGVLGFVATALGTAGVLDRKEWLTNFMLPKPKPEPPTVAVTPAPATTPVE